MDMAWMEHGAGSVCAEILATVPHWFGIAESNEAYRAMKAGEVARSVLLFD